MYERNTGADVIRLVSSEPLPPGQVQLELQYEKVSTGLAVFKGLVSSGIDFNRLSVLKGTARLRVNGQEVGSQVIEQPFMVGWEGLDIGQDTGSPVSPHYQAPFAFQGQLSDVEYQLE